MIASDELPIEFRELPDVMFEFGLAQLAISFHEPAGINVLVSMFSFFIDHLNHHPEICATMESLLARESALWWEWAMPTNNGWVALRRG